MQQIDIQGLIDIAELDMLNCRFQRPISLSTLQYVANGACDKPESPIDTPNQLKVVLVTNEQHSHTAPLVTDIIPHYGAGALPRSADCSA